MNAFAMFSGLILVCLARELIAICPADRTYFGPCIVKDASLVCPPNNYCSVNTDGASGECCSGAIPIVTPTPPTATAAPPCVDLLSDCAKNVAQCTINSYRVFMTTYCPKTCGRCGVACADANNLCTQWAAQGFCESSFYTTVQKQEYCRATCGYC
uniref:ShKT domain-containing protein n=1 Tax=Plectus sambesii TaxID=2011161 RepID=A0A914X3L0_9BILA